MSVFADREAMDTRLEQSESLYLKLLARVAGQSLADAILFEMTAQRETSFD